MATTNTAINARALGAASTGGSGTALPIKIHRSDRVLFVGKTGCGKTTLAQTLLAPLPWVVVLDPKHQFSFKTSASNNQTDSQFITSKLADAEKWQSPKPIVYRPSRLEAKYGCPTFWDWIWERQNTIVYVDDVIGIAPGTNAPDGYARAVQMGRGKNIGVWSSTQRPARIPQILVSEAEHFFAFQLTNPSDIKRVSEFTDPIILEDRAYKHDCWYYSVEEGNPRKINARMINYGSKKSGRTK